MVAPAQAPVIVPRISSARASRCSRASPSSFSLAARARLQGLEARALVGALVLVALVGLVEGKGPAPCARSESSAKIALDVAQPALRAERALSPAWVSAGCRQAGGFRAGLVEHCFAGRAFRLPLSTGAGARVEVGFKSAIDALVERRRGVRRAAGFPRAAPGSRPVSCASRAFEIDDLGAAGGDVDGDLGAGCLRRAAAGCVRCWRVLAQVCHHSVCCGGELSFQARRLASQLAVGGAAVVEHRPAARASRRARSRWPCSALQTG